MNVRKHFTIVFTQKSQLLMTEQSDNHSMLSLTQCVKCLTYTISEVFSFITTDATDNHFE